MAKKADNPKTEPLEEIESDDSEREEVETENLSTKISNIGVVNSSLQTVSKTCHSIKESNSYVGYGMSVAETSLDKAFKAGKAVLDSRTLAPITNTAMDNIRYLDKEAGVMVDKLLKTNEKPGEEKQANGAVQEGSEKSITKSSGQAVESESMMYFLGRTFFQVTSFLIFLPYFGPKYALCTILGLFQGSSKAGRKRKERGSLSEELKYMEPSPVKRKYGDRLSTSSEEGTLVEILRDYVSEDDPDYVPNEHESEGTSEESGNEKDRGEEVKECLDLTQELEEMGVPLSADMKRNVDKLKSEGEINDSQSTPRKTSKSATSEGSTAETTAGEKDQKKKMTGSNVTEPQKLEEIPLQPLADGGKDKTEASKESKVGKIDPSSKTRKSAKSPLLEKLLSPGRRSRKGQKDKTKTEKGSSETAEHTEDVAGEKGGKSEGSAKTTMHAEKLTDSKVAEVKAKVDDSTKSKAKTADERKKSDKAESSKEEVKEEGGHHGKETLSTITGPFDVFKFGGKKSK